ncbi:PilN domain-containing protein [Siccibacter turicensis]|uniref:Fimbrial assembly protein n=1 Tax=Siccibacter turicensis TaxID=357233 RepID=A0A2P8VHT2_9ENTR|nr:PilN domain-containing protein [Siccibacter turicensis]PSN07087.1 hypothetical protein C7G83_12535 [Siccibacter turicensis]
MSVQPNLLAWRAMQRRQRLRVWGLLLIGSQLIVLATTFAQRTATPAATGRLWEEHTRALQAALASRVTAISALATEVGASQASAQQRALRLAENRHWQSRLTALEAAMPDDLWLTQLQFSGRAIIATGFARTPAALAAFDAQPWPGPAFSAPAPGATGRNEQGQFAFSLRWAQEGNHARMD